MALFRALSVLCVSALATTLALGCSSAPVEEGDDGTSVDDITPESAATIWTLAELCDSNITRHSAVKAQETAAGVVRWQCGDRDGVDGELDRGQEYCEYMAVSNGRKITKATEITKGKPLQCLFTSVYSDVDGQSQYDASGKNTYSSGAIDGELAAALSTKENLDASIDPKLVRMKGRFNTRGAATTLIADSMRLSAEKGTTKERAYQRAAACYLASKTATPENRAKLKSICERNGLASSKNWKSVEALGVKVAAANTEGYEPQQSMYACMSVNRLQNGGVDWRMSDPHITEIVVRASLECGCRYDALPTALGGFLQGTWAAADKLPPGCRRAKLKDGTESQQLTICDVPAQRVAELENDFDYSENLSKLCNEMYGKDIVMTAPARAVEKAGSCVYKTASAFCADWTKGAK
ncbi:MAG TPA: hypothetical protein PLR99_26140 [Polyangiaceae bacterium]|nr:hypothetical protein [Polyangiaceae bacterium]